jgi:hypothetical protein
VILAVNPRPIAVSLLLIAIMAAVAAVRTFHLGGNPAFFDFADILRKNLALQAR